MSPREEQTMGNKDLELMAHLLRRAGFGATRGELEEYMDKGYEAAVEELLNPTDRQTMPEDLIFRYHVDIHESRFGPSAAANWLYRMITTKAPLEEKTALFWHGIFATGYTKTNQARALLNQIDMFRQHGMGKFDTLLVELSKDPAMTIWLDNQDNRNGAINENFGRELLELFSMGVGNYTEDDIKEASRAFTGWTLGNAEYMAARAMKDSIWPYSRIAWHYGYRPEDHDDGEKTFLAETGNLNGEDVVEAIGRNPATAEFVARHLYDFFVADEAPVPPVAVHSPTRPCRDQTHDRRLLRERPRDKVYAAGGVQLGLLQVRGRALRPREVPPPSSSLALSGRAETSASRAWTSYRSVS